MINNIIFDLGNVLLNFKPLEYLYKKIPDKQGADQIYKEIFRSPEWLMLDRGVITESEAIERICNRNNGMSQIIRDLMDDWYQMLTPIEGVVEVLKGLKLKGYRTYFLSNFHLLAFEDVTRRYDFFKSFNGGIVSYKEKLMKPEREIFDKLISTYEISTQESIFIDDTKENIEVAAKLGFETILFTNACELRENLVGYNVV